MPRVTQLGSRCLVGLCLAVALLWYCYYYYCCCCCCCYCYYHYHYHYHYHYAETHRPSSLLISGPPSLYSATAMRAFCSDPESRDCSDDLPY